MEPKLSGSPGGWIVGGAKDVPSSGEFVLCTRRVAATILRMQVGIDESDTRGAKPDFFLSLLLFTDMQSLLRMKSREAVDILPTQKIDVFSHSK